MRYLLDTNIISNPANLSPSCQVADKMRAHHGHMAIASITWQELVYGVQRLPAGSARRRSLSWYLILIGSQLPVLPFDQKAASWQGEQRARLYQQPPSYPDGQIAAVAATQNLILVTNNTRHFRVFDGLTVEDWMA